MVDSFVMESPGHAKFPQVTVQVDKQQGECNPPIGPYPTAPHDRTRGYLFEGYAQAAGQGEAYG